MWRWARWSQNGRGPHAHAPGAPVVQKQEAPMLFQRWPLWSQSGGGPRTHVAGASVVPKWRRPRHPCGGGFVGPKTEAPARMRRGPPWSPN